MGVLELFATLLRNEVTASSIKTNYREKTPVNHLLIDFNSIIHVSSRKITVEVNMFMQMVLKNLFNKRAITNPVLIEQFEKYKMTDIQSKITQDTDPNQVVKLFKDHFNDKYMDELVIVHVINTVLGLIKKFCQNLTLYTLMLAIDGVPSKGKMVEQKQRRYMGAIVEAYKKKLLAKYTDYLKNQDGYVYQATRHSIEWNKNKITPGTGFMDLLVRYLRSRNIEAKFKFNRPNLNVVLSDMYEVGEGEKKIVNYVGKYLANTDDSVMVYSPDADVILLCMLMPVKKLYMLRYNDQTSAYSNSNVYDLIDIRMIKGNIAYYINNHPSIVGKISFEIDRIINDIVCVSTLFGNDFAPKIETINVKKGFQSIMDAYVATLLQLKDTKNYLVRITNGERRLSFTFLKTMIVNLLPEENDFIKHNDLYTKYISIGQIKNVFDYMEINSENLEPTVNEFRREYNDLQNLLKNNRDVTYYETNERFISSLKKCIVIVMDGQQVNTITLTNKGMIKLLRDYHRKTGQFPKININLNTWSHSINDFRHKANTKGKNDYEKEKYKFENMLDEYYTKFNAQPLQLSADKIGAYYQKYFGVSIASSVGTRSDRMTVTSNGPLTKEASKVMHDYIESILWVFRYYFNDMTYVNTWYYEHERAPLLRHLSTYLSSINKGQFDNIYDNLVKYQVEDLATFFNPVEQLIYVSPMTPEIVRLLPSNYRKYILSSNLDPFLKTYFVDVDLIADRLWKDPVSKDIDCKSIPYFNKCLLKSITKPTASDDKLFLKSIRKVKPIAVSKLRSQSKQPAY